MKTPTLVARLLAVAVLVAPPALLGSLNEETIKQLGLTRFVEPLFPECILYDGLAAGHVALAVSRNPQGEPVDILVLEATHPKMAEAAVEAVRNWRFAPSNNPADLVTRTLRLSFRMQGIVVFPFGKDMHRAAEEDYRDRPVTEPVAVPSLQALPQSPKALVQPMPAYPLALLPRKVAGTAVVRFYVDEDGRVRLPEVIQATEPEFAEAALAAVKQWRYEPPQLGGRRVIACDNWNFKFAANN